MLNTMVGNIRNLPASAKNELNGLKKSTMPPLALDATFFKGPYRQIDFLLTLNETLGIKLPDLDAESAEADLLDIFRQKEIALPARPTLPRLLDKLSALYLEPQCDKPTWIINHPECLSPLSKSFSHPSTNVAQQVAARAELFIHGHEIVNCYEEENSPFEQRRKFLMQQRYSTATDSETPDPEAMPVDEDYLKALEWGLPPTGGWGCGIDRLVMLLTGKDRINDVLTFGNLRTITRAPEFREMVRLPTSPLDSFKQNAEHDAASEDAKKGNIHTVSTKRPFGRNTSKAKPQLDAVEQAVIKIREKLNREKSGRTKQSRTARGSSIAEQKRLATWLAGRGEPNAVEKLLNR
jgi:tRNA synthetases class II (D, K and N)